MTTGSAIRLSINLVAASGVTKILSDIVKNNVNIVTTKDALLVKTGTLVLGSMIAEHAASHVNEKINMVTNAFSNLGKKEEDDNEENKDSEEVIEVTVDPSDVTE